MVSFSVTKSAHMVQILDLILMLVFFCHLFRDDLSMRENVSVDCEDVCDNFINSKMICQLNFL